MEEEQFSSDWPHEWIKKIRSRPSVNAAVKRMRQIDLAKRTGVDPRTVQQWENGDRLPSVSSLKRIIQAFKEDGLFIDGTRPEAERLWSVVQRFSEARSAAGRQFPDFDTAWFESLRPPAALAPTLQAENSPLVAPLTEKHLKPSFRWVGRERSIAELQEALKLYPLITIAGPGGIGKTALAVRLASELSDFDPDGIRMFEFGTLGDPLELEALLLSSTGLQRQEGLTGIQTLAAAIRPKRMLFIFDNCEHLIDTVAVLAQSLLELAPSLSILTTGREHLNIPGEFVYRLAPLSFPSDERALRELSESEMKEFEAVRLFLKLAKDAAPRFSPNDIQIRQIGEICRKLDGIPLAIELAVARMRMLTLEQIDARLTHLLDFLTAGRRTAEPRQQTLKSTIDWSYHLLSAEERSLLNKLGLFSDGFTLEAAETICAKEGTADSQGISQIRLLDVLSALVDKSLVDAAVSGDRLSIRYSLLESVKEYANEQLLAESDLQERKSLYDRHLAYYADRLIIAEDQFRTRKREEALIEVRQEYANLRAALFRSHQQQAAFASGVQTAANLYWFWLHEDRLEEGLLWIERFSEKDRLEKDPELRSAKLEHGRGVLRFVQENIEEALVAAELAIRHARNRKDFARLASSLRLTGFIHIRSSRFTQAEQSIQESLQIAKEQRDLWNQASSFHACGKLRIEQQRYDEALFILGESVRLFEEVEDRWEVSGPYESMGYAALKLNRPDSAIEYFKKSIAVCEIYKGFWVLSRSLEGLAIGLCAKKTYSEAAVLWGAAEKCRQYTGTVHRPDFPTEYRTTELKLRTELQEAAFEACRNKGARFTKMQMLAFALES